MPKRVEMFPVSSSNVDSLGYDDDRDVMIVEYAHGGQYEYRVDRDRFEKILNSDSVGKALHKLKQDGIEGRKI